MIDSHMHLDLCEAPNADVVVAAQGAGVDRLLTVGIDPPSCRTALAAAAAFPSVYAAVGRHPNSATGFDDDDAEELRSLAAHPRCVAIGETGLDFYRERAPREDQLRAFGAQIALAREVGKPLIIHTRAAEEETLAVLGEHASDLEVVMHCFSMPERLDECLERGWWISFAGNVTYPSAADLRHAGARVPTERLLVETDSPFLAPQSVRGRPNEPAHVVETARLLAEARGVAYDELDGALEANAAEAFGW